jgi:hypothetical protein
MADLNQAPAIKVLQFKTAYERLPVKGDPLDENVDERGFKLNAKGQRILENQEVDWVLYAPSHSPLNTGTWERVRNMRVTDDMLGGKTSQKLQYMTLIWSMVEPHYDAWKKGHEITVSGTPLGVWAGMTAEKAEVLRRFGIRTVEEVANLSETQMEKLPLPGVRAMRREAMSFLENCGASEAAAREADRDNTIAALEAKISDQNERMAAMMDMLEAKMAQQDGTDDVSALRAELDRLGIEYHHKAGVKTLRALLDEAKVAA